MATTLTYTDMILVAPPFLTEDLTRQAQITASIQRTDRGMSQTAFGAQHDDALLWLAAHKITMADRANVAVLGGTGAVTSRATGENMVTYTPIKMGSGDNYRATPYGSLYLEIRDTLVITPCIT